MCHPHSWSGQTAETVGTAHVSWDFPGEKVSKWVRQGFLEETAFKLGPRDKHSLGWEGKGLWTFCAVILKHSCEVSQVKFLETLLNLENLGFPSRMASAGTVPSAVPPVFSFVSLQAQKVGDLATLLLNKPLHFNKWNQFCSPPTSNSFGVLDPNFSLHFSYPHNCVWRRPFGGCVPNARSL